jgi:hypothetical protein
VTDDKPASPWREKPYTILPNSYLLRLAHSDLTARAQRALLVILTETRGSPGQKRGDYGRDSKPVSTSTIARGMGCSTATARRATSELRQSGWVRITKPAAGSRAWTYEPLLNPRRRLESVPEMAPAEQAEACGFAAAYVAEKMRERRQQAISRALGEPCG